MCKKPGNIAPVKPVQEENREKGTVCMTRVMIHAPRLLSVPGLTFGSTSNLDSLDRKAEKALLDAGMNKDTLKRDWGVTLWRMAIVPNKRVFVYLDPGNKANPQTDALIARFQRALSDFGDVTLKLQSVKACCGSGCSGCLAFKGSGRKDAWL
jgi:hypothetical protein